MALPFLSLWLPNPPGKGTDIHRVCPLRQGIVDPFGRNRQLFWQKRSTLLAEKVNLFGGKGQPFW